MAVTQKLKIELPYYVAIPFLSIYPKEWEVEMKKIMCTPLFIAALFTIAKKVERTQMLIAGWTNKMWHMHAMGHYSAFPRKAIQTACNMDGPQRHWPK